MRYHLPKSVRLKPDKSYCILRLCRTVFVTFSLIIATSEVETCTLIQGCDVTINDSCYAHVDDNLNWDEAENCCVAWGGHLASIHSDLVNNLLNDIRRQDRFTWIGLSDTVNDSVYVWSDGTPFDYDNFGPGQADDGGETCINFFSNAQVWSNYFCDGMAYGNLLTSYICQKREFTT